VSPPTQEETTPAQEPGPSKNIGDNVAADSVPQGTCPTCGGPIFYLSEGYTACRTCNVEFNAGRRLAETLDDIVGILREYLVLPTEHEGHALALWVAQTHLIEAFDVVMFLHVFSPEPESGKTRLLEVLSKLVRTPWLISRPTAATLFRMIEERQPTLLWDEIDRVFSVKQEEPEGEGLPGLHVDGVRWDQSAEAPRYGAVAVDPDRAPTTSSRRARAPMAGA